MLGPMLANKEVRAWLEIIAPDIVPPQPVVKKPPLAAAASSVQKLKLPSSVDCRPGEDAHRIFNVLKPIKPVPDDDMWIFAATVNAEASEADARAREAESRVHAAFGNGRRGPTHLWDQNVRRAEAPTATPPFTDYAHYGNGFSVFSHNTCAAAGPQGGSG
ncbi:hypothetical protein EMIHUDRAFT_229500 [Emiliania huxleyi CCMP1516]|uniref:Uncharacterized protein n=2 Tax=Emiliania huxleyi TaxID=2903 RepID=A0A0D3KCT6_EMIH1|nr:hypothetical protein EMIHUDRAFT_229500 [Emiliania huxleyi CCMP1516]EOD33571.1 hypothetical protein EMIHUDRAFT_229500 [Emiliania huxleyi CCMP1516]|eukprot:XP_005786000.1 hypothetical protein EMIHUDRAFT_229500 [Emiliania huxleyi CCMP1516]